MRTFFRENGFDTFELLHNNCSFYGDIALCGTRGWFYEIDRGEHSAKIFNRELMRLEASLKLAGEREKFCFLHYPPLYQGYRCQEIIDLLERYGVKRCYYGHLHGACHALALEGLSEDIDFRLVAADRINFTPIQVI
jgi:predicted phosphohydrolase